MTLLALVLEMTGFVFISLASVTLVLVMMQYFKGMKIPAFWIYIMAAFYLAVAAASFDAVFSSSELTQATRLLSNILAFAGVYSAYRRMKSRV